MKLECHFFLTLKCYSAIIPPSKTNGEGLMAVKGILVAFPGEKTRTYITGVLEHMGITVEAACGTGVETISHAKSMKSGILLAGEGLLDMTAQDLRDSLPRGFYMILLARPSELEECQGEVTKVAAPATEQVLVDAVLGVQQTIAQKAAAVPQRSPADKALIAEAKAQLMHQKALSEEEAYRFIQKLSMNMGYKMVQTAREILAGQITA